MRFTCPPLLLFLLFSICTYATPIPQSDIIPGRYIAVFKKGFTAQQRSQLFQEFASQLPFSSPADYWDLAGFCGFVFGTEDAHLIGQLKSHTMIDYVERDRYVRTGQQENDFCTVQAPPMWGPVSSSVVTTLLNDTMVHKGDLDVYVMDSGISLEKLGNNGNAAILGANFVDSRNEDCGGHGTRVAETIGQMTKSATLIAVKVVGCDGLTSSSLLMKGLEWSVNKSMQRNRTPIINVSFPTHLSRSFSDAVGTAIESGVMVVVGNFNENGGECLLLPQGAKEGSTSAFQPSLLPFSSW